MKKNLSKFSESIKTYLALAFSAVQVVVDSHFPPVINTSTLKFLFCVIWHFVHLK